MDREPGDPRTWICGLESARPRRTLRIMDLYPHRPPLSADLPDHLDRRAPGSMMGPPQTVKHPALVRTLIACAAMADPALPA
jgi:hypothetical protein